MELYIISSASVTSFIRELLSKDKEISNIRVETSKKEENSI